MTAMELITAGFWLALGGVLGWVTLWCGLGMAAFTYGFIKGVIQQLWHS